MGYTWESEKKNFHGAFVQGNKNRMLVNLGLCLLQTYLYRYTVPQIPRKLTTNFLVQKISVLLWQCSLHIRYSYIVELCPSLTCMKPRWQVTQGTLSWIVSICSKILESLMAKCFQHFKASFSSWFGPINFFDTTININELIHSFPVHCLLKTKTQILRLVWTRGSNSKYSQNEQVIDLPPHWQKRSTWN